MNRSAALLIAGVMLVLVAYSHAAHGADPSSPFLHAVKAGDAAGVGRLWEAGAAPNLVGSSGLTALQVAVLAHDEKVAALPKTLPADAQLPLSPLASKRRLLMTVLFPSLFGMMALFFLVIGLRGLLSRRPFLISARWLLALLFIGFCPALVQPFAIQGSPVGSGAVEAMRWLLPALLIAVAVFLAFTLRGYTAFGVTEISMRQGLVHALEKLKLPHEETLSAVRLTTLGADLQVGLQSWTGTGQLKMKQRQFGKVLRDIVRAMNEYYQRGAVTEVNLNCCIFYTVIGAFMAVFAGVFLFGFSGIF